LYRSDGTAAGTTLVKDINPGPGSSAGYSFFTVVGNVAYFDADDGSTGDELWTTNGTSAGTTRVQDLSAGAAGSSPAGGVVLPSRLLFSADTPQFRRELWKLPTATPPAASVVGRHVYYNASSFDHGRRRAEPDDDAAVATDKAALLPGGRATFANYTSYRRGINGIMADIANLPTGVPLTAADFTFKVGNNNTPSGWAPAPLPREVTLRWGAGENGSARVSVTWADGAIFNKRLQVTVLANPRTGLAKPDVFYFGNRVSDTGTAAAAATATVDALELAATRRSLYSTGVTVTSRFDFDRDGRVTLTDLVLARRGAATRLALSLISPPTA
jgi:ELWxxDGT repeat protein